jgi:hypothetical protein
MDPVLKDLIETVRGRVVAAWAARSIRGGTLSACVAAAELFAIIAHPAQIIMGWRYIRAIGIHTPYSWLTLEGHIVDVGVYIDAATEHVDVARYTESFTRHTEEPPGERIGKEAPPVVIDLITRINGGDPDAAAAYWQIFNDVRREARDAAMSV